MFSAVKPVAFALDIEGFSYDLQVREFRTLRSAHLLQSPTLQPPGERVALAADLAQRSASERGRP